MNNGEIIGKVHNSMYQQIKKSGMATPVQVLMDLGYLSATDLERWRFGKIDYLERVCKVNLHKLSFIMKEVRAYARKSNLKTTQSFYKQLGAARGKALLSSCVFLNMAMRPWNEDMPHIIFHRHE